MKINKREFVRGINKYLNTPGTYELVSWGKVVNTVVIDSFSCAPNEVKIVDKDNVEKVINGIKLDKGYVEEKLDLNKFYPCGHQRFPLAQFCRKCV